VAWSLADFPDDQLAYLLDGRTLLSYHSPSGRYRFYYSVMGNITDWNPRISHEFLDNLGLIGSTQLETILALTDWMRGYLIHYSGSDDFNELWGYPGPPPVDRVLYSLRQPHKTAGCWGTSGLYAGVLRSVNIPVRHERTPLGTCSACGTHSRPAFPSVGLSMPHADDPYNATLRPSGVLVPSEELFFTEEEMQEMFLDPAPDCSGGCNSSCAQASVNSSRHKLRTAHEYMANYLLYQYAIYGADYLDGTLRGFRVGGEVQECALPLFSSQERARMILDVEQKLIEMGGGSLEAGKQAAIAAEGAFGKNIWP
jgi:hypothetical protein